MKFVFLIVFLTSFYSFGHDFFFAFSELEYNQKTKKIECTITVSTHDFEGCMNSEKIMITDLNLLYQKKSEFKLVENYIKNHFKIWSDDLILFKMIGTEISLNGTMNFYLESEEILLNKEIKIFFDLLMDQNKTQQNKITFIHNNNSYTKEFFYSERLQTIKF